MAHYTFIVHVETDDSNEYVPDAARIKDEIRSHLEYDGSSFGINNTTVQEFKNDSNICVLPCGHAFAFPLCTCESD